MKDLKISKELLSEVMGVQIFKCFVNNGICSYHDEYFYKDINIYELAYLNLKQWAKLNNVFDKIDWSEETEQIFKRAEELRNEIN